MFDEDVDECGFEKLWASISLSLNVSVTLELDEGSGSMFDEGVDECGFEKFWASISSSLDVSVTSDSLNSRRKTELSEPCSKIAPIFEIASHDPFSLHLIPERVM